MDEPLPHCSPPAASAAPVVLPAPGARWLPLLLGVGLWTLYVFTAAPGLSWYDAGELTASAWAFGIPHPTGFPLWLLLAKGASLLPLGSIALRVTLLGAACLVGAALLVGRLGRQLAASRPGLDPAAPPLAEAIAAIGLACSAAAWRHATAAEVYGLHALTVAALLCGLAQLARRPSLRGVTAWALLAGLGLGGHGELRVLLLGALLPALALALVGRLPPLKTLALTVAAGTCGLAVHLALPLRALARPAQVWDDLTTVGGLLSHLRAARIFAAFAGQMGQFSGPLALDNLRDLLDRLVVDVGLLGLLALCGVVLLGVGGLRRGAPAAGLRPLLAVLLGLLGCLAVDLGYTLWVNPMGLPEAQVLLVAALAVAPLAGVGAALLIGQPGRAPLSRSAGLLLAGVGLYAVIAGDLSDKAHPGLVAPAAMVDDALAVAPPHALLLVGSDSLSSGLVFVSAVEGARPDLRWAVRQHLWNPAGRSRVAALFPAGGPYTATALVQAQLGRRTVRWEHGGGSEEAPWLDRLVPGLPTWRISATPLAEPPPVDVRTVLERLASWAGGAGVADGGREAFTQLLRSAAWHEAVAGRLPRAARLLQAALQYDPASVKTLINLGAVASRQGRLPDAAHWTEQAVALRPSDLTAQVNLGRYRLALRDVPGAEEAFRAALAVEPRSVDALAGLGAAVANQRRYDEAERLLEQALRLAPDHAEARQNLQKIRELRKH